MIVKTLKTHKRYLALIFVCLTILPAFAQGSWTLRQCLDYARENNIQLQKSRISQKEGEITLWQDKGALFPSLSFATSQSIGFRPFEKNMAIVQNGQVTQTSNKFTEQGSYGLNASWTVWNGGINHKNVKTQEVQNEITKLAAAQSELSIQEQIAQLYVQILYSAEAKKVNEQLFDDFTVIYILEVVENNFDSLDFYLYRLKFLIPKMTYEKLRRITHIKDCKKRIIKINHFLKDNISMKDIYTAFSTKYPDFTNEYV